MDKNGFEEVSKVHKSKEYLEGRMGINNNGELYLPVWFKREYSGLPSRIDLFVDKKENKIMVDYKKEGKFSIYYDGRKGHISINSALIDLGRSNFSGRVDVEFDEESDILIVQLPEEKMSCL